VALAAVTVAWLVTALSGVLHRPPVRSAELAYARAALRLTLANGGVGLYGRAWGVWRRARMTPGLGFYQPDFQCAEYVMRSLRAAGYAIATPPETSAAWPDLVNVDRAVSYLMARGIARPAAISALRVGDAVAFRYLRDGPNRWGHIAIVIATAPLRLAAHDRDRWNATLKSFAPYRFLLGLHTVRDPRPPDSVVPLAGTAWAEVALRDPPLRRAPAGAWGRRLYLGLLVKVDGIARAPGSYTGWLRVRSGGLTGWLNGDAATRLPAAPITVGPATPLWQDGRPLHLTAAAPVRGAWGHRLYVDAQGCPVPAWTGRPCAAPYTPLRHPAYPRYTVTASRAVSLTLSPVPGSLAVAELRPGQSAAAEYVGPYAAVFAPGGPAAASGVLYAPASAFTWRRGGDTLVLRALSTPAGPLAAGTAGVLRGGRLVTALPPALPLPAGVRCVRWQPAAGAPAPPADAACVTLPAGRAPAANPGSVALPRVAIGPPTPGAAAGPVSVAARP
jgi:hypothetical protein